MYSSNPDYGQRKVAESTRKEFLLEKFSHSTVCRSFKTIEQIQKRALERYFGEEFQPSDNKKQAPLNKPESIFIKRGHKSRCFPSVEDTSKRRSEIAVFLKYFHIAITKHNTAIEAAAQCFAEHLHGKSKKLRI